MRLPLAVIAAVLPCAAFAQTNPDSPENITVTATRVPSQVQNLPAGVTIIDRKTIEERGYVTLVDALSAVPGLRVAQTGGAGAQTSVFIRGTNSNQVLVLRDGVPINDPSDPGGAFNFGVDTLNDVERIEVVRGPASSAYGSGAIGGVINLITRPPAHDAGSGAPHGSIVLAAGAPRQALAQANIAGGFGITDYAASLESSSILGFDTTPQRLKPLHTGERDGDRSKQAQIELGITPFQDTRFSILLRARDNKYGFDESYILPYDSGNATGYEANLFGRLGATTKLLHGVWDSSLYLTGIQNDRRSTIAFQPQDPNQGQAEDRYRGRRADLQWNNTIRLPDRGPFTANALTFGTEHQSDQLVSKNNDTNFGAISFVGGAHAHADSDAFYLGAQTTIAHRLAITGQMREDATTIAGDAFTWRLGGVLDVPEILSHIKASYGTSFRAPALNDRYGRDNFGFGTYTGNPNLRPERGEGTEAGITTDISTLPAQPTIALTYFHNRIRDLIVFNQIGTTVINIAQARTQGIEAALTLHAATWLQADLTYTYTDARDLRTGTELTRRPLNQASANLRITPTAGVIFTPELLYTGAFRDFLTRDDGSFGGTGLSPSGLIFNLNATWQITRSIQLFAWGKNLGNSRFEPVNGYQTPGASFLAGARAGF